MLRVVIWNVTLGRLLYVGLFMVVTVLYYFCLPSPLFHEPSSTLLEDRHGELLTASIASDGQWRFPDANEVPDKFRKAILLYEDKRFEYHPGIDPIAFIRAVYGNITNGKVVSGGSTLTMQVIRLSRHHPSRSYFEKLVEMILATRLEWKLSKKSILCQYVSHAPFGGNVVGIEAACWRYFGRSPSTLSWSEASLLAVLPNNPSLINLGKNREILKQKRDMLLDRLLRTGEMDALSTEMAKAEPLPENPFPLPRLAPHLADFAMKNGCSEKRIASTLDKQIQLRTDEVINNHYQHLRGNQIFNGAAIILEVRTGNVLAYVGNTLCGKENQEQVDIVQAPRSTGSILKPFLFAGMLKEGKMLQHTLVPDVPTLISGYSPKNFSREFDGAVSASQALIRSLNIPAVYELKDFRYEKFYNLLKGLGMHTLNHPADHYGLSLILGGAEGSLWDITGMYASMARALNNYFERPGKNRYAASDIHGPVFLSHNKKVETELEPGSWLNAASIYITFDALKEVYRPGEGTSWKYYAGSKKIAWKTGTSFGFRDGWAVGVNPDYAVGVWVGNADGEGRPGLIGSETAAPILFDLFSSLQGNPWFQMPLSEMKRTGICKASGYRASNQCEEVDSIFISSSGLQTRACPFHKRIFLSRDGQRVRSDCKAISQMVTSNWFVLPPIQEFYFKPHHLTYKPLPPWGKNCISTSSYSSLDVIYPKQHAKIYLPRELDGQMGSTVFEASHRNPNATLYWHIDGDFLGTTTKSHRKVINATEGKHLLTLLDDKGETINRNFLVNLSHK